MTTQPSISLNNGLSMPQFGLGIGKPATTKLAPQSGSDAQNLALDLVFSASRDAVSDVWCRGVEIVNDRHHRAEIQAAEDLRRVFSKLRLEH